MTTFPALPFDRMTEVDVREDVLVPLIDLLGYRIGTDNDVIREQSLRYDRLYLGRKNPARDPVLRGKADYILEVQHRIRWVIEAKAPGVELGFNEFEQAWSYANHGEVRAVYFVLCNGLRLLVFSTRHGPNVGPLLDVPYSEFETRLHEIVNLLGPTAIERDHPDLTVDVSPPIGPGLRSVARLASGVIRYLQTNINSPALRQLQIFVIDGSVERNAAGFLTAYLKTQAPLREMQEFNEQLGFDGFELVSTDSVISIDPQHPTVFTYEASVTLPQGSEFLDINSWKRVRLPVTCNCRITSTAAGALSGNTFSGSFQSQLSFAPTVPAPFILNGDFSLRVV